jgi:S1-C subfamily serine protease
MPEEPMLERGLHGRDRVAGRPAWPEPDRPRRRQVALVAVGFVWVAALTGLGLAQVGALRGQLGEARKALDEVGGRVRALQRDLRAVDRELARVQGRLPPDVAGLVARVRGSIFTVEAGGVQGTGFVVRAEAPPGFRSAILTNAHVVEAAVRDRRTPVFVSQGSRRLEARLGAWDEAHDLALLFVVPWCRPLPWWDDGGHRPAVGDFVLAIGSPYRLEGSSTTGVISKITRSLIQTDAAVNPGNSGGPLLNRYGEVVGVVSYRLSVAQNINFAVPIQVACDRIFDC